MISADVLVIGAGPSGSAAAITLARSGRRVILADRHTFPRDKVCGDGLIPDALAALRQLDLEATVRRNALTVRELRVFSPNRTQVTLRGEFACQPRAAFDAMLQQAAVEAGVTFLAPYKVVAERTAGGTVVGAVFSHPRTGDRVDVEARVTLLATGAAAEPLATFGVCTRPAPSAIAARAYYRVPGELASRSQFLAISFDKAIRPGYGWVFPGPDNVFNLGVAVFQDSTAPTSVNLRELWRIFLSEFDLAANIASRGTKLTDLKGAPLRTAMTGAEFHRAGLLVLGEAAGLTFSFSGEGIGKAMESGLIAGRLVHDHLAHYGRDDVDQLGLTYEAELKNRFSRIFRNYRQAQEWLSWPSLCNLIAWRANRSPHVRRQLEGLLSESVDPREVFSLAGLLKSFGRPAFPAT